MHTLSLLTLSQVTKQEPPSFLTASIEEDMVDSPVTARKKSLMKWKKSAKVSSAIVHHRGGFLITCTIVIVYYCI